MKKRTLSAFLCTIMMFSFFAFSIQASALEAVITPRWTNCSSIEMGMTYANSSVSWTGSILGYNDTTEITARYTLEKLGSNGKYTFVAEWTGLSTTTKRILNSSGSASGTVGTYRLTVNCTIKSATYSEPITLQIERTFS